MTEKEYRVIFKGNWFKYKSIPLTHEFVQFLDDETQQIDEIVMSKHLQVQGDHKPAREVDGDDDEVEWD